MRFIPAVSLVQVQLPLPYPDNGDGDNSVPAKFTGPVGQVVKTPAFHAGDRGSSPLRVTNNKSFRTAPALKFLFFAVDNQTLTCYTTLYQ